MKHETELFLRKPPKRIVNTIVVTVTVAVFAWMVWGCVIDYPGMRVCMAALVIIVIILVGGIAAASLRDWLDRNYLRKNEIESLLNKGDRTIGAKGFGEEILSKEEINKLLGKCNDDVYEIKHFDTTKFGTSMLYKPHDSTSEEENLL
ncbi:MAG: hypothetical protein RR547_01135 [Raoultibacter sp.]